MSGMNDEHGMSLDQVIEALTTERSRLAALVEGAGEIKVYANSCLPIVVVRADMAEGVGELFIDLCDEKHV